MTLLIFALWIIGGAKTVIDDYEFSKIAGFTDWPMIFGVAAAWPIIDAIYVYNTIKKRL